MVRWIAAGGSLQVKLTRVIQGRCPLEGQQGAADPVVRRERNSERETGQVSPRVGVKGEAEQAGWLAGCARGAGTGAQAA